MDRIIIHWTAGRGEANAIDRAHYHALVEADGTIVYGDHKPEANADVRDGRYAAHTRALNTGSIGIAVCAMWCAKERPFDPGPDAITHPQLTALVREVADLAETYDIAVGPKTVLTHAEVQETLGVAQRGKWDVTWLPGMPGPEAARVVGDRLRRMIAAEVRRPPPGAAGVKPARAPASLTPEGTVPSLGILARLFLALARLFGAKA